MRTWLIRLYPARWRARYGDEFAALLEERQLGPFDVFDILLGALDAQLHLRGVGAVSEHRKGFPMTLRLGGIAAILGGALWIAGLTWTFADSSDVGEPGLFVLLVASVALLVGMAGLSAFQAREHPMLVWAAFLLPALGTVVATVGIAMMAFASRINAEDGFGWGLFILGLVAIFIGSGLFGVVTYRTGALPRSGAAVLGIASVVSILGFVGASGLGSWIGELFAVGLAAFAVGWIVLGVQAIGIDRRATTPRPA